MASVVVYFKLVYVLVPVGFWIYLLIAGRRRESAATPIATRSRCSAGSRCRCSPSSRTSCASTCSEPCGGPTSPIHPRSSRRSTHRRSRGCATAPGSSSATSRGSACSRPRRGGGATRNRRAAERDAPRDPLMVGLAIWFVVGWVTVLIQNQWGYQFMLPLVPLGLFAVVGVDRLRSAGRVVRRPVRPVAAGAGRAHHRRRARRALPGQAGRPQGRRCWSATTSRSPLRDGTDSRPSSSPTTRRRAAAAFVREPGRTPGAIHVEGNPLIQYLSGRPYALRVHGWAPEQSDARLWKWTRDGLRDDASRLRLGRRVLTRHHAPAITRDARAHRFALLQGPAHRRRHLVRVTSQPRVHRGPMSTLIRDRDLHLLPRDALVKTNELDQADWNFRPVLGWVQRLRLRCVASVLASSPRADPAPRGRVRQRRVRARARACTPTTCSAPTSIATAPR